MPAMQAEVLRKLAAVYALVSLFGSSLIAQKPPAPVLVTPDECDVSDENLSLIHI